MLFAHYDYRGGGGIENLICLSVFGQVVCERRWNHMEYQKKLDQLDITFCFIKFHLSRLLFLKFFCLLSLCLSCATSLVDLPVHELVQYCSPDSVLSMVCQ